MLTFMTQILYSREALLEPQKTSNLPFSYKNVSVLNVFTICQTSLTTTSCHCLFDALL